MPCEGDLPPFRSMEGTVRPGAVCEGGAGGVGQVWWWPSEPSTWMVEAGIV